MNILNIINLLESNPLTLNRLLSFITTTQNGKQIFEHYLSIEGFELSDQLNIREKEIILNDYINDLIDEITQMLNNSTRNAANRANTAISSSSSSINQAPCIAATFKELPIDLMEKIAEYLPSSSNRKMKLVSQSHNQMFSRIFSNVYVNFDDLEEFKLRTLEMARLRKFPITENFLNELMKDPHNSYSHQTLKKIAAWIEKCSASINNNYQFIMMGTYPTLTLENAVSLFLQSSSVDHNQTTNGIPEIDPMIVSLENQIKTRIDEYLDVVCKDTATVQEIALRFKP